MTAHIGQPIVIICGTNRPNSVSMQVAKYYQAKLTEKGATSTILDLAHLPTDFITSALYGNTGKNEAFNQLQHVVSNAEKFVFVIPEYNGSFPGVLKAFIDGMPYPNSFTNKKAALVGISSNPQGAIIALSHLSDVFSYLGMNTLALRIKIGQVKTTFVQGEFTVPLLQELVNQQLSQLIEW